MEASKLFVPGMWQCPQCGFTQQNHVISPAGVYASTKPELRPCPNDGRDMVAVTWEEYANQADETLRKLLQENDRLVRHLERFAPWRVWWMNDCDWWLACTREEAIQSYTAEYGAGCDGGVLEEVRVLTLEELEKQIYIDREKYDPLEPEQWECIDCGQRCTLKDRWNGHAYEHSHPHPVGHCETRNVHKRTFAEELARRIAEGPTTSLFASTEH